LTEELISLRRASLHVPELEPWGCNPMIKLTALLFVVVIAASIRPGYAQVMLDVAKITCNQWSGYKITNPQNIALWLSGYYNGKRNNTMLDTQALNADMQKLRDFCIVNPDVRVMEAIEKILPTGK
jgi:acid stress chaperone HdeB